MSEATEEYKASLRGKGIAELAKEMVELQAEHADIKKQAADVWAKVDHLRLVVLPALMEDMGATSMKIDGVGRLAIQPQLSCKTVNQDALREWLVAHGGGALIKDTVNSSSLKSFINHQLVDGKEIPGGDVLELKAYDLVSITKG